MNVRRFRLLALTAGLVALAVVTIPARPGVPGNRQIGRSENESTGGHRRIRQERGPGGRHQEDPVPGRGEDERGPAEPEARVEGRHQERHHGVVDRARPDGRFARIRPAAAAGPRRSILGEFWYNFRHNLFKPLLLFFYLGFLVPILRVKFEFPYVIYQGLTIYLLLAIGWHGGEELSTSTRAAGLVFGFMCVGFVTNFFIGIVAYMLLSAFTNLQRVDKATVAGYYGSDSAGTFVTCLGVLATTHIAYDAYMPVMLAIMEIPGCLVALYLVSGSGRPGWTRSGTCRTSPATTPRPCPSCRSPMTTTDTAKARPQSETKLALEEMDAPRTRPAQRGGRSAASCSTRSS